MMRATAKMLKGIFLSVWGGGKTTLLTVVVALTLATVTPAFAANGSNFILGSLNNTATAITRLVGNVAGPALYIVNPNTGSAATAATFQVASGHPPFKVNSSTKVPNLNADQVDGYSAPDMARVGQATSATGGSTLTDSEQDLVAVGLTAPKDGFVLVLSDYMVTGSNCPCEAMVHLHDEANQMRSNNRVAQAAPDGNENTGSISWVFPATAGVHSYILTGVRNRGNFVFAESPSIVAVFIPFGSTGQPGVLGAESQQENK